MNWDQVCDQWDAGNQTVFETVIEYAGRAVATVVQVRPLGDDKTEYRRRDQTSSAWSPWRTIMHGWYPLAAANGDLKDCDWQPTLGAGGW